MKVQKKSDQDVSRRPDPTHLVRRYGQIGIDALKAVLQYSTSPQKPPRTIAPSRFDERFSDHAA
jgi:hypothetical protein